MTNYLVNTKSLLIIVFLFSLNSLAGPCATALSNFPLDRIDYVGIKFSGPVTCIEAVYEKDARSRCSGLLINPANPQYTDAAEHDSLFKGGTIDVNPQGFFYCIPNGVGNNKTKGALCNTKTIIEKSDWDTKHKYSFTFQKKASGGTDGDCMCKQLNTNEPYKRCNREPTPPPDQCEPQGLALAKYEEYENLPDNANLICVAQVCKCPEGSPIKFFPSAIAKESCAKKEALKPPAPAAAVAKPPVVAATQPDSNLKKCVDDWKTEALKCKQEAEDAKKNCGNAKQATKEDKENTAAINAASGLYTAPKANTGMQQECFTAGLVATGAKSLLGPKSDVCAANIDSCKASCSEENINNLRNACAAKINTAEQPMDQEASTPTPNSAYFMDGDKFVKEITEEAGKVCTVDATKSQFELGSILSGVGNALAQSLKCMCQTSGGTGDCATLPTPGTCDLNPATPGCGAYGALAVCTPGASYDAKTCSCQLNPKESGCPGGAASGGLSGFASPSIKSNGINEGVTPTLAGGLKAAGAFPDLPRGSNDDGSSGGTPMTLGASPTSGPGGGSGGSLGGGGASGGGEPPAAAAEAPAEEKGLGGLFNQAKTFFKDAIGGKKTPTAATKNGKSEKSFDPNKLRPTRGIASKNGIGSKNQDIWKMSNSCMYAETCPRNMNSFLDAPLKQK